MQPTSDEENGLNENSLTKVSTPMDSEPFKVSPDIWLPLKCQDQRSEEKKVFENIGTSEQSKPTEMAIVPVLNPAPQSPIMIFNIGDGSSNQPTICPEAVVNISVVDMSTNEDSAVKVSSLADFEHFLVTPDIQSPFRCEVQRSAEDKEFQKIDISEQSKSTKMDIVPILNRASKPSIIISSTVDGSSNTSDMQLPLECQVQVGGENKESEKVVISEQSKSTKELEKVDILEQPKSTKTGTVPELNPAPQPSITISNSGDGNPNEPTICSGVVEQSTEPSVDISIINMPTVEVAVRREEMVHQSREIQLNLDLQDQYMLMNTSDKEVVLSGLAKEKDTISMVNKDVSSSGIDIIPEILETTQGKDAQLITDLNCNIERELFLSTEITEVQEQSHGIQVFPTVSKELMVENTPIVSPLAVNELHTQLVSTSSSDLDLMLNKAKLYSESFSRSVFEFSESLTTPAFYEISQNTKDEVESFCRLLELPLAQIATDYTAVFTDCVYQLMGKKVLPLAEQIRLEEFCSTLSENLTAAAICQKQMKEKRHTIDEFVNVSKKLDTMGNNIQHLRDKLQQIDMEEAELIARLGKLKEQKRSLLAVKESINDELANINYDEQEIESMVAIARDNFLKNQERYNAIDNKWSYFKRLFIEFKCKIR